MKRYRFQIHWRNHIAALSSIGMLMLSTISFALESAPVEKNIQAGNQPGNHFMDFSAEKPDGENATLSGLIKGRAALVYFYSACCYHCNQELPKLAPLTQELSQKDIAVVGIQWMTPGSTCPYVKKKHHLVSDFLVDSNGKICESYGVGDFTVITIDKNGIIRYRGGPEHVEIIKQSLNGGQ